MSIILKIQKIHYSKLKPNIFSSLLWLGSLFYSLIIYIKNFLYEISILKEHKVNAKVICVGNLTTGGVGKTPLVCEIVKFFQAQGKRVAVLSRGYGGSLDNKNVNVIKNYDKILINDARLCGDEAYLIAQNTDGAIVLTCKNRLKSAIFAIERFGVEIIIMDDGFSNRKIFKDLNIILIDCEKMFGNEKLLPLGPLREPLGEIKRAQKIVLINKGLPDSQYVENAKSFIEEKFNITPIICDMKVDEIIDPKIDEKLDLSELKNKLPKAFAFCAIGQPDQFYAYVEDFFTTVGTKTFIDHYQYSQNDIKEIKENALSNGIKYVVTTQKDYVKIKDFKIIGGSNIFVLKLKLCIKIEELLN